ncbi:dihydrodipicolinate reductase [Facklamia sp. DSM 111018]|uniref:Dihydrodipicolinate reductase n=1 Tax=Facklamia lactis TaxID=2749967 RepID=A0ABS0LPF8_9LACT|nr:2,4-diaminopentanoate dehydrogenase [Facklamia lactis]MBG9980127.1 dihydrodipicolinate reductase [Facklamia lactis]MBG9985929.1 dihydrodipicolinate reductase [Facklamia lactis]
MENVKVVIWGIGAMGSGVAKTLLKKKGVDIVGAIDIGDKVGKPLFEVLGEEFPEKENIKVGTVEEYIKPEYADIVVLCTDSFVESSFDKIKKIIENKMNVISSAEEMAYPKAQSPELTEQLDQLAKENDVTVLGTGINPGHIMDLLVLVMTGALVDVKQITSRRVNSLSPFGPAVMEEQGIGISVEEFEERKAAGKMSGHVGFAESVQMMADALGVELEHFETGMEAIVTDVDRKSPYGEAKAGSVAGVAMTAKGMVNGEEFFTMDHPQQIEPEQVGIDTGDYVIIDGTPKVNMVNSPEIEGGLGTIAMLVNMIPKVINSEAGVVTMIDLPIPHAILGDFREQIKENKKIVK